MLSPDPSRHCPQAPSGDNTRSLKNVATSGVLDPGETKVYQVVPHGKKLKCVGVITLNCLAHPVTVLEDPHGALKFAVWLQRRREVINGNGAKDLWIQGDVDFRLVVQQDPGLWHTSVLAHFTLVELEIRTLTFLHRFLITSLLHSFLF